MKKINLLLILFVFFVTTGCATSLMGNLEAAKFALDKGNYSEAITKATAALNSDPDNVEAARVLASAYFSRSGMDFLDIAEAAIGLHDSSDPNFKQMADAFPETADADDVRSAIETLEALDGITGTSLEDDLADAAFDLGLMQVVEHYALGVYGSDYYGTFDVTSITSTDNAFVQDDLIDFDNYLVAAGIDSNEDWIEEVRQTFCILEPISAGQGFTLAEYQAYVGCQLDDDPDTFDTEALTADIADCSALDPDSQDAAVQACYSQNTSL